jgi:hypothetical protein
MNEQDKNEIRIFKHFAELCPYSINPASIIKQNPPALDILCQLSDGSYIAFELVESIDGSIAKSTYGPMKIKSYFDDHLKSLPRYKKKKFKSKYKNAMINVAFNENHYYLSQRTTIKKIFSNLLNMTVSYESDLKLNFDKNLNNKIHYISISRGDFVGPIFNIGSVTSFADPCKERIKNKFKKKYEIDSNIDLLVYYEIQPMLPEKNWLPPVEEFIKTSIDKSLFQRVWIYSVTEKKIIYTYPNI